MRANKAWRPLGFSITCASANKDVLVDHLQEFHPRRALSLPVVEGIGWQLKQYAILADGRDFDDCIAAAAAVEALKRLPAAGSLIDRAGNHGVGFQIVHFAEVAVVSPVFYWQWGSVLASIEQLRAPWEAPTAFGDGVKEVVGCVWEMDVVSFEINAWKTTLLNDVGTPEERLAAYLEQRLA